MFKVDAIKLRATDSTKGKLDRLPAQFEVKSV